MMLIEARKWWLYTIENALTFGNVGHSFRWENPCTKLRKDVRSKESRRAGVAGDGTATQSHHHRKRTEPRVFFSSRRWSSTWHLSMPTYAGQPFCTTTLVTRVKSLRKHSEQPAGPQNLAEFSRIALGSCQIARTPSNMSTVEQKVGCSIQNRHQRWRRLIKRNNKVKPSECYHTLSKSWKYQENRSNHCSKL